MLPVWRGMPTGIAIETRSDLRIKHIGMELRIELDPENETGGFCNGAVHVKWFFFAAAQRAERLKIAFQAVDPPLVAVLCSEAGRPFFVPSPAFRIPERAEGVKGPKR